MEIQIYHGKKETGIINQEQNFENGKIDKIKTKLIIDFTFSCFTLSVFFVVTLILKYLFQIFLYTEIFFLILGWAVYSCLARCFIKKKKLGLKTLRYLDFAHYVIALIFVTAIFYYTGGAFWIGAIFYVFIILYASFLSTPKEGFIITLFTFASYVFIVLSEYFNLLPHKGLFDLTPSLYQDNQYIITTILLIGIAFTLIFITGTNFARILKVKNEELEQNRKILKEFNERLEEKVSHRTQELKNSKDQLSVLYQISRTVNSTLKLDDILQTILDFSIKISNADRGSIMLLDKKNHIFFVKIPYDKSEKNIDKIIFPENENTVGWVVKNKKPLYIEDLENDKQFTKIEVIHRRIKQLFIIPVIVKEKVIGIINLENTSLTPETIDLLKSFAEGAATAINNANLYQKIQESYFEIVKALAHAIEAKDPYTHGHSARVVEYANSIAQKMNLQEEEKELLKYAAILHDIGKIGVSGLILNAPRNLTDEEYNEIKKHPSIGENIIQHVTLLKPIKPIILHHHEWYNGNGYPHGLSGEKIPLCSRILAVADVYDAIKSDRPYRKALTDDAVIRELKNGSGTQFDPKIVEIFLEIIKQK